MAGIHWCGPHPLWCSHSAAAGAGVSTEGGSVRAYGAPSLTHELKFLDSVCLANWLVLMYVY